MIIQKKAEQNGRKYREKYIHPIYDDFIEY